MKTKQATYVQVKIRKDAHDIIMKKIPDGMRVQTFVSELILEALNTRTP